MTRISIKLDQREYSALLRKAESECRPTVDQARYLIRQALGLSSAAQQNDNRSATDREALTGAIVSTN